MRFYKFLNELSSLETVKTQLKVLGYTDTKMKGANTILAMSPNWRKGREEELEDVARALQGVYIRGKTPVSSKGHVEVTVGNNVVRVGVKPISGQNLTHYEDAEVNELNKQLIEFEAPITVVTFDNKYVIKEAKQRPTMSPAPKSDFELYDPDGNPVIFISHKDAKGFQQYSGISERGAGTNIGNHSEVKRFYTDVLNLRPDKMTSKDGFYRPIADSLLKQYAVWGPDFGKGYGINNVQYFAQGKVRLKQKGKEYELVGDLWKNGYIPTGDYEPVLFAYYNGSSSWQNIKDCRAVITTIKAAKKRERI